jgi:hypothetical protein
MLRFGFIGFGAAAEQRDYKGCTACYKNQCNPIHFYPIHYFHPRHPPLKINSLKL